MERKLQHNRLPDEIAESITRIYNERKEQGLLYRGFISHLARIHGAARTTVAHFVRNLKDSSQNST